MISHVPLLEPTMPTIHENDIFPTTEESAIRNSRPIANRPLVIYSPYHPYFEADVETSYIQLESGEGEPKEHPVSERFVADYYIDVIQPRGSSLILLENDNKPGRRTLLVGLTILAIVSFMVAVSLL